MCAQEARTGDLCFKFYTKFVFEIIVSVGYFQGIIQYILQ